MITLTHLAYALRRMRDQRPDVDPVIRIERGDPRFDWAAITGGANGGVPGIDVGQLGDIRVSTAEGDGLHVHTFADRIEVHLDRVDPLRDPLGHLLADTGAAEGALKGAGLGLLLTLLTEDPRFIGLGAGLGAMAGATTAARRPFVVPLQALLTG